MCVQRFDHRPLHVGYIGIMLSRQVYFIDGGKKAYLSEHDLGDQERTYKEISCSGFSEDIVARIDALLF